MTSGGSDVDEQDDAEGDGDAVSLVRLAGARPLPSLEATAAARAHVHAAWRAGVRQRRAHTGILLAAAGFAAAAVAVVLAGRSGPGGRAAVSARQGPPAVVVGRLDAATGLVEREVASGWERLAVGDGLAAGGRVRTVTGGAGLRAPDGRSVRLAPASRLVWDAADRLKLEAGAVYLDSGPRGRAGGPFEVGTPWGAVRETGTQYEVRLEAAALRIRVREGRVAVAGGRTGGGAEAAGGFELRIDERGASRRAFPVHGPEWAWVLSLAPGFEMDGRTLHELASWAAREAGWELRYVDSETERRSRQAVLRGSVRGLRPDEAAVTVIPSTGLAHRVGDGVLRIGPVSSTAEAR